MTGSGAQRIVLGAMAGTAAISIAADLTDEQVPAMGIVLGALLAAVMLSALTELAPDLAAAFAVLVLVSAFLSAGVPTLNRLRDIVAS